MIPHIQFKKMGSKCFLLLLVIITISKMDSPSTKVDARPPSCIMGCWCVRAEGCPCCYVYLRYPRIPSRLFGKKK